MAGELNVKVRLDLGPLRWRLRKAVLLGHVAALTRRYRLVVEPKAARRPGRGCDLRLLMTSRLTRKWP